MSSPSHTKLVNSLGSAEPKQSENPTTDTTPITNINLSKNLLTIANKNDFPYILKETGNRLVVVEFFANWCGPCQKLATKLEVLANAYNGKILIVKVNVDEFEELTLEYNVSAMPTFLLMRNKQKLKQFSSSDIETLEKNLEKYAGKAELNETNEKSSDGSKGKVKQEGNKKAQ